MLRNKSIQFVNIKYSIITTFTFKFLFMLSDIKGIGFDADDTLWENENFFRETEAKFEELIKDHTNGHAIVDKLFEIEIGNLDYYGYGIKSFILSMIETALKISTKPLDNELIQQMLDLGKEMMDKPVILIDGIKPVLEILQKKYTLIVATKGDLKDQERKLVKSGLEKYFHHIEVMTDKQEVNYDKLLKHLNIKASEFFMVGNSLKSDVIPVLNLGGFGAHIPYYTTWIHEEAEINKSNPSFFSFKKPVELLDIL